MRDITLDIQSFEEKAALHQYLKEQLGFSYFYGCNLDALHDELTSDTEPLTITLRFSRNCKGKMAEYLPRLLTVFRDAARENYNLTLRFDEVM